MKGEEGSIAFQIVLMVSKVTFILLVISFLGAHLLFEIYFKKNGVKFTLKKVLLITMGIEGLLVFLAAHFTLFFYVLIHGSVIIASFISVYFRHKQDNSKLYKKSF